MPPLPNGECRECRGAKPLCPPSAEGGILQRSEAKQATRTGAQGGAPQTHQHSRNGATHNIAPRTTEHPTHFRGGGGSAEGDRVRRAPPRRGEPERGGGKGGGAESASERSHPRRAPPFMVNRERRGGGENTETPSPQGRGRKRTPTPAKIKTVAKMGHKTVTIITPLSQFFTNLSEMAHNVLKNLW